PIGHARDLSRMIAHHAPGTKIDLVVRRGNETKNLAVTLAKLEDETAEKTPESQGAPNSGALGLYVEDAEGGGALVRRVAPDSAAAGLLQPGDIIVEVDRKAVTSANELRAKVAQAPTDKALLMRVKRGDGARFVVIDRK